MAPLSSRICISVISDIETGFLEAFSEHTLMLVLKFIWGVIFRITNVHELKFLILHQILFFRCVFHLLDPNCYFLGKITLLVS